MTIIEDLNEDQEEEISELLNMPSLKGSDLFINVITFPCHPFSLKKRPKKSRDFASPPQFKTNYWVSLSFALNLAIV